MLIKKKILFDSSNIATHPPEGLIFNVLKYHPGNILH